jgi:1-aminocyclopropane-1-carboxylate deaminase/D-cysteine desulfhydrase-like pyridoxal-dependent ACC family enzyme
LMEQCHHHALKPAAVVHTSSSGGTHAGLVGARALARAGGDDVPEVLAIGVAKGVNMGLPDVAGLAGEMLELIGGAAAVDDDDVCIDSRWLGEDYAIPTEAGDAAIRWAARHGGWVLDRVYSGKGLAGLLGNAAAGRWPPGSDVVFIHTGGMPAIFTTDGVPTSALA